jgi:pimeloyl-ACP methyl ester carboxylesterase
VLVSVNGHWLELDRIEGRAPTLVFLHEGLGCVARWRDFPRAVAAATGNAAIVYSRRGYGQSDPAAPPWPLTFMHDEARRELPALLAREGVGDAVLVGHSDGASIALVYTGEIGRGVRGVVALAPHVFVEDVTVNAIAALREQYAEPATEVRRKLAKHHADVDGVFAGWADAWLNPDFRQWDLTGSLPGVNVPVLVIQGEDDEYGTLAQVDAVCAGVAGPVERLVLARCGHVPQRDRGEETLAAVVRFVRGLA